MRLLSHPATHMSWQTINIRHMAHLLRDKSRCQWKQSHLLVGLELEKVDKQQNPAKICPEEKNAVAHKFAFDHGISIPFFQEGIVQIELRKSKQRHTHVELVAQRRSNIKILNRRSIGEEHKSIPMFSEVE